MDVLAEVRSSRMTGLQIRAVAVAMALIIMDGFEIAMMAFTAKPMADAWGVSDATLGIVLSASLFGMAAGAILFSPVGDRLGRRPLTTISVAIVLVGMVLAAVAPNVAVLIVARFLTGFGIGAMSQLNAYVSEFASDRRRGTVVGIYATGFPIGATLAGVAASLLVEPAGWKSMFVAGAVLALVMLVVSWAFLPESIDFLVARRPKNALERVNTVLNKMGRPSLKELPEVTEGERAHLGVTAVFGGATGRKTLVLWLGYACLMASYYFANSWIPKLAAESTGDDQMGTTVGSFLNFGGIFGSLLFAAVAIRVLPRRILQVTMALSVVGTVCYGATFGVAWLAVVLGVVLGVLAVASVAGFYAVAPEVYPAALRGTGVGWMLGVGRLVSIVSPISIGYLLDGGWSAGSLFYLMAVPLAIGTVCITVLARLQKREAGNVHRAQVPASPSPVS